VALNLWCRTYQKMIAILEQIIELSRFTSCFIFHFFDSLYTVRNNWLSVDCFSLHLLRELKETSNLKRIGLTPFFLRCIVSRAAVVIFINILRTNFLYKSLFGSFSYLHVTRESKKDVRTKNLHVKCWWNWHLCVHQIESIDKTRTQSVGAENTNVEWQCCGWNFRVKNKKNCSNIHTKFFL
jgi:hypothetical protein